MENNYQNFNFKFQSLTKKILPLILNQFNEIEVYKPKSILEIYLKEQFLKKRKILVALNKNVIAGYITLKIFSSYEPFFNANIPEICDLFVFPKFRNQGLGSILIEEIENKAKKFSPFIGLGVGLSANYGAAQQLYFKKGYIPDGKGITYENKHVKINENIILNDNLLLWLIKKL